VKKRIGDLSVSERLTKLRTIDAFTVSRYRIAMRAGAKFPAMIVDRATGDVVSGNHTLTAMLGEFGPDHVAEVDMRTFKSEAEKIRVFTHENVKHGRPMDGFTMRKIAIALTEAGESLDEVAKLLNVPVAHLDKWGGRTVVVVGKDKIRRVEPLKAGTFVPTGKMTEAQYERHATVDMGMSVAELANQLADRLERGLRNVDDESEVAALERLKAAI
jgi:DNA-binding transcriptional regulator YiaG